MEMLKRLIICAFICTASLIVQIQAQSQSGFISIDCGIPEYSNYTDLKTGINYVSDATFIDTGVTYSVLPEYKNDTLEQQFYNVRSFPEGSRNCYTLKPEGHDHAKFLIRARFMYGNYDGQGILPTFNLLLESDVWTSIEFNDASATVTKEIIHIPRNNYIIVCLENAGTGTPFISALEVRPLKNSSYGSPDDISGSLVLFGRFDLGLETGETIRFKNDVCDRIWLPYNFSDSVTISTSDTDLLEDKSDDYQLPTSIMSTAVTPVNPSSPLRFHWEANETRSYHLFLHTAEIVDLQDNQTREFNISANGDIWYREFSPYYYLPDTIYNFSPFTGKRIDISINKTKSSTEPPTLNALEIYWIKEFSQSATSEQDVDAIINIKRKYGVKKPNWQGDPCVPQLYVWEGLDCSYSPGLASITHLNLSSSGLTGEITPFILGLTSIQSLDLTNNCLTGSVPEFLTQLENLSLLNLKGNNFEGSIPAALQEKVDKGLLLLSFDSSGSGNSSPCSPGSRKEKIKFNIVPVVASVVPVSVILAAILAILWIQRMKKARKKGSLELKNRRFSHSDVVRMTNNFERVVGKGGFGIVYHGYLDDAQVAVKMLSQSSAQGYKEFQAEVELLMRVYHKNLTALVGYCDEGNNMALIYEFMANGNLEANLSENQAHTLTWEGRVRIATEAAQGLAYLHSGCKPPIIHRDIKSTNILLDQDFQAKLADFGLSRSFPVEGGSHVSTNVAGTPGYLDPEYYISNRLTDKSDVYSFGIVLLEIITGKPVIEKSIERTHISQWVDSMLSKGDNRNIVDPRLQEDFDNNSVWKAVEIAMACASSIPSKRPTMNKVVTELNECLAMEIASRKVGHETESTVPTEMVNLDPHIHLSTMAR